MENKRTVSLLGVLFLTAAVVVGISILWLIPIQKVQAEEPNKPAMSKPMRKCTMGDMDKCMAGCMEKCQANMKDVSAAKVAIKAAIEAMDEGDTKAAKIEMEKADKLLANVHKCMQENMEQMPCNNAKCPITGKSIERMNCPKEFTRMCKGKKVGFCCASCPIYF